MYILANARNKFLFKKNLLNHYHATLDVHSWCTDDNTTNFDQIQREEISWKQWNTFSISPFKSSFIRKFLELNEILKIVQFSTKAMQQ